jgi:uncharacterized protein (DUF1684 family)
MDLRRTVLAAALALSASVSGFAADPASNWTQELDAWRAQHAKHLQEPDGWLTVVGLDWLKPGVNTVGAAADNSARIEGLGVDHLFVLRNEEGKIRIEPTAQGFPAGLTINGNAAEAKALELHGKPDLIRYGDFSFFAIARGDGYALRVRNANSDARLHFHGLHWYKPDPAYRITAQWVPYAAPRKVEILSVVNTTSEAQLLGEVHFTLHGQPVVLAPIFYSDDADGLFFVLRDATSKTTTYQASRFLSAPLPSHGLKAPGTVELDFNRLENPPCAFTAFATCPLPLAQNRLTVAIEAGEQRYHE